MKWMTPIRRDKIDGFCNISNSIVTFHPSYPTNTQLTVRLFQVDTGSFMRSIENCARPRSCRTARPPSRPPRPTPRRRRWAVPRAPGRAAPCWAFPVRLPRNRRTSTTTRRPACCRSSTSVTAGTPPTCSYCATSAPPGCWTLPRSCPATTRSGVSRIGRYPPRTPANRTWSNTSRRRSNSSVSDSHDSRDCEMFPVETFVLGFVLCLFDSKKHYFRKGIFRLEFHRFRNYSFSLSLSLTRARTTLYNCNNAVGDTLLQQQVENCRDDPQYRRLSVIFTITSAIDPPFFFRSSRLRSFRYFAASSSGRVSGNRV